MRTHLRIVSLVGAALMSTASVAADLVPEMRPSMYPPAVSAPTSGWYLRGFIGASNESLSRISHPDFLTAPQFVFLDKGGFDSAPFGGGGIGFQ
jgi:opacity protein-like surface antigen